MNYGKLVIAVIGTALLSGCVATQSQVRMEQDQQEIKRRLAVLERNMLGGPQDQPAGVRLDSLNRQLAEQQATIDSLRVELQSLSGRLEDTTRANQGLRDELSLQRDDLGLKVNALEERLMLLEGGRPSTAPSSSATPTAPATETPQALYQRGLDLIMRGADFPKGRELLGEFLRQNPGHNLSVNAMYWIGEAYYGEKKFENAILQFQDVIQQHPDHPKAASSMLKQAMAFDSLGDRQNARVILRRLSDTHPLSEEAKRAKELLAQWS